MLTRLWNAITASDGVLFKILRVVLFCAGLCWSILFILLPLAWKPQILLGLVMMAGAILIGRSSQAAWATIALMLLSLCATLRYAWWRIGAVVAFFHDPSNRWDWADAACICILLSAETYAFVILFLGFMQTVWPLKRPPVPLPREADQWPHVDLLIPTYNEPLSVVRYTALASMNVDWPTDKLHIYILDDGRREPFRAFAAEAGVGYITREDNKHAKAGNINRALDRLNSPYVAIFDCDHLPTRSFLQVTMGWFLREDKLAMVQTPHHFYSADPFERNLKQFRLIPNEGELFYGVVQDGNDFWNATFFCGSCAVLRRTALDQIGGIAVETVTEDAHTSLRMQMRGWNTAYINIPQAAGLATERLSGHIQQRVRWARGMIQILRTDNPLFVKGLKFAQRICYFNAMTHFLYAVPRLIFLTAPLVYLFFSRSNVPGFWAAILAYAMPHLVLSNVTNSRIQGQHRHSFWNEIYETVLSPYILLPTLTALINPKLGKFNVTAKGGFVEETYFDGRIATPFVVLLLLNLAGLLMVIPRLVAVPGLERFLDAGHPGTIAMNALWCIFNVIILGVAITVAREEIQRREQVRIDFSMPARIRLADGRIFAGQTVDLSIGGAAMTTSEAFPFTPGEWVTLLLPVRVGDAELPSTLIAREDGLLRLQFESLSLFEQEMLTTILYSRADAWLNWGEAREPDRPLRSFYRILKLSGRGLWATFSTLASRRKPAAAPAIRRVAPLLLFLCGLACASHRLQAQSSSSNVTPATPSTSSFSYRLTLSDLGATAPIDIHGLDGFHSIPLVLPRDQVVEHAILHLVYRFSPQAAASGRLKVSLNGTAFATLDAPLRQPGEVLDQLLPVPAELLVRKNQLTFEFQARPSVPCDERSMQALWGQVNPSSSLELSGQRLLLSTDLAQLPLPFIESDITRSRVIPIVLSSAPSRSALQAAGVVASYFGMKAEYPVPRFPVSLGSLPQGNAIVVAESSASPLLLRLGLAQVDSPRVVLCKNPNDPFGTILIVTGANGDQLLLAAQAVALQWPGLQGSSAAVADLALPSPRSADDAPRWAKNNVQAPLWRADEGATRPSDGSSPVQIFLRVPPDLYAADKTNLDLHLEYRYTAAPLGRGSALLVQANGNPIASIALDPSVRSSSAPTKVDIPLPVASLRPFSNSITAQWSLQRPHTLHCSVPPPDPSGSGFSASILNSSFIDLRGLSHWAAMPNLELFSNAGFPFTRFADLSQTTVILPGQPSTQELELYLTLLAHFSAQTGYPALRVTVGSAADLQPGADQDFLVIGTGPGDPAIAQTADAMPVAVEGDDLVLKRPTTLLTRLRLAWQRLRAAWQDQVAGKDPATLPTEAPSALIMAAQSPYTPQRTWIVLEMKDQAAYEPFLANFLDATHSSAISGDVSLLHGNSFQSFTIKQSSYALGHRPWITGLKVSLMRDPWYSVLGLLMFSLIAAACIQAKLRQLSKVRLHLEESPA
jgi:cellulose synthase (UDP-forming)